MTWRGLVAGNLGIYYPYINCKSYKTSITVRKVRRSGKLGHLVLLSVGLG